MESVPQNQAEKLGYARDAKLLIIHADDLGMSHSVNAASMKAFETGFVNSGSIMVPCPWFPEIASYAKSRPNFDLGIHLTLTSEWNFYRWRPVTPERRTPTLYDKQGYFYASQAEIIERASIRDIEIEIRNQIERACAFGIRPTHLDSHMNILYTNQTLFKMFLEVSREYKLPVMMPKEWFAQNDLLSMVLNPNDILIDRIVQAHTNIAAERWQSYYTRLVKDLKPGVTEIIAHLAYDDEEMRAVTTGHVDWGASWRQRDFDFFTSEAFHQLLEENDIKLVTFLELGGID